MKYFLVSLVIWIFSIVFWHVDSFSPSAVTPFTRKTPQPTTTVLCALEVDATSEVVGGHGKIGSLFLKEDGAIAVPRGIAPGCLTTGNSGRNTNGSPIIVAIPPRDWKPIFDITLSHRQSDLVWVIVGDIEQKLSYWQQNSTVVVLPHLDNTTTLASSSSGSAYVYGKHGTAIRSILTRRGITDVSEVGSWVEMCNLVTPAIDDSTDVQNNHTSDTKHVASIPIPAIDLVCTGECADESSLVDIQSVICVGGGITGSSIARALSQRGIPNVTVYDPTPAGTTTSASWAWLNANQKPPHAYKSLNQLGLRGWRSDPLLSKLPSLKWSGTLVQTKQKLQLTGGYTAEGPLNFERIRELEPEANFTNYNETEFYLYYFADEGHVNPQEAVLALRQDAKGNGVTFVDDERVVGLVRDSKDNRVIGVKTTSRHDNKIEVEKLADVVIVSAGANCSNKALGGVPLVHNPSRTYFSNPSSSSATNLKRTLVDMVSSLYLAQRKDGAIVAGGGAIKFGLSATSTSDKLSLEEAQRQLAMAQELAQQLAPNPVGSSRLAYKKEVVSKPMPKDGFPILGYVQPGLYSAVTHSGMTLSPLIGQLVAAEVKEQVSLNILNDYRPTRFGREADESSFKDWQESEPEVVGTMVPTKVTT